MKALSLSNQWNDIWDKFTYKKTKLFDIKFWKGPLGTNSSLKKELYFPLYNFIDVYQFVIQGVQCQQQTFP